MPIGRIKAPFTKGYSFFEVEGRRDTFVLLKELRAAGYENPQPGDVFEFRIGSDSHGRDKAIHMRAVEAIPPRGAEQQGTVKWFNAAKGYGFIQPKNGKDIFVHVTTVRRSGMHKLYEGQRIRFKTVVERGRPTAVELQQA